MRKGLWYSHVSSVGFAIPHLLFSLSGVDAFGVFWTEGNEWDLSLAVLFRLVTARSDRAKLNRGHGRHPLESRVDERYSGHFRRTNTKNNHTNYDGANTNADARWAGF